MDEKLTDEELERLVGAWIAHEIAPEGSPESEANWWAHTRVLEWSIVDAKPELLWQFVAAAYKREMPDTAFAVLAAGPMEDLLAHHGPDYIDRVEELARKDPKFNRLLGGVWKNSMTDEIWHRVQAIRKEVW